MKENKVKIKICGLTTVEDAQLLNKYEIEYAGFVLFYEKSKRYNTVQSAWNLMRYLKPEIKKVAVTVSPTVEQIEMIEHMEFDYLQVHGELSEAVICKCQIPILRAYNISSGPLPEAVRCEDKIAGYVLDAQDPGSGRTFDWPKVDKFDRRGKLLFLAGGLNADNVQEGIDLLQPDVVDVSTGVEGTAGKDEDKIKMFVRKVREYE